MDKKLWKVQVTEFIIDNLEDFFQELFDTDERHVYSVGKSYRVDPCPFCGHSDSFTVTGEYVKCFSGDCGWKSSLLNAWYGYATKIKRMSLDDAARKISEFSGLEYEEMSEEEIEEFKRQARKQELLEKIENFYHERLINCTDKFEINGKRLTPLEYQTGVRFRQVETLKDFRIGFTGGYLELRKNLLADGYKAEEIKEFWVPENLFIYFYRNPLNNKIVRINTKNAFKVLDNHGRIAKGFSIGDKAMYFPKDFKFGPKDYVIVCEGENDVLAYYEAGEKNVCGLGGNPDEVFSQLRILQKARGIIYLSFDNDDAGKAYLERINNYLCNKDVRKIKFDEDYNDPDEFLVANPNFDTKKLIDKAEKLETNEVYISRKGSLWIAEGRDKKLEFILKSKNDKNQIIGDISFYKNGEIFDKMIDTPLMKAKASVKPLNFKLYDKIEAYLNNDLDKKSVNELVDIYKYSSSKSEILKRIALHLHSQKLDVRQENINTLKVKFGEGSYGTEIIDTILKELNNLDNKNQELDFNNIPIMKICQFFSVRNNDGYMYFNNMTKDGDTVRKLPYLLRNDGEFIRLDLLKRKDPQCLLLVDNKYELPYEVEQTILETGECSLTQDWALKYKNKETTARDINQCLIIRKIESYIRKFYYTNDQTIYKVVSLYIYMTYFYELFGQVPYLFLNGEKGSGKSVLDTVIHMFAFDAKMAVDISEAALYRIVSTQGGTMILDEMENLTSRSKTVDSTMSTALKSGYCRSGSIYRYNNDINRADSFSTYGPKIISNIFGLDDVISDRCICINTYRMKISKDTKLEDPKYYFKERLDEIRDITSRCALSALAKFSEVQNIYSNSLFETENARLSQILTPIQAIAKFVDADEYKKHIADGGSPDGFQGSYEKALCLFYEDALASSKENTELETCEGIIKKSVQIIAKELYGIIPKSEHIYTIPENHKFTGEIPYNLEEGWFEISTLHFKCFIEEHKPGENIYQNFISRWVKTVFKHGKGETRRKYVTITNKSLLLEFKDNKKPRIQYFKFYFSDFISVKNDFLDIKDSDSSSDINEKLF